MALTVNVAGASSDSYATVAEADTFLAWRGSDAWTDASTASKEGVLKAAARYMDELHYEYPKSDTDQALRLPVSTMREDGAYYVPDRVKEAQAIFALRLLEDPDLMAGGSGVSQVSVPGAFSVTYGDGGAGRSRGGVPEEVLGLLDRYLWKSGPRYSSWNSAGRGYE